MLKISNNLEKIEQQYHLSLKPRIEHAANDFRILFKEKTAPFAQKLTLWGSKLEDFGKRIQSGAEKAGSSFASKISELYKRYLQKKVIYLKNSGESLLDLFLKRTAPFRKELKVRGKEIESLAIRIKSRTSTIFSGIAERLSFNQEEKATTSPPEKNKRSHSIGEHRRPKMGKQITKLWRDEEGNILREEIHRLDAMDALAEGAKKKISYLETLLEGKGGQEKSKIEESIRHEKKVLSKCKEARMKGITWANSDYFRDILRGNKKLNSKENPEGLKGAVREFERLMNEDYYLAAPPVNMRYHTCQVSSSVNGLPEMQAEEGWLRVGVVSDMSNGFVNLESLQNLEKALQDGNLVLANHYRNQMIEQIVNKWISSKAKGNNNVDAAAAYALMQLGIRIETIEQMAGHIEDKKKPPLPPITPRNQRLVKKIVQATIHKREDVMSRQFLQMVVQQVEHASADDLLRGQLNMVHIALLNHHSKAIDGTGWYHDEENQMRDMAAIFDKFDGKELIFDGKGPFIDLDGNIHLPRQDFVPVKGDRMTLRSFFLNESVQGYTKNDGTAKELNDRAKVKLSNVLSGNPSENEQFLKILERKHTSYSTAADMVDLFVKAGFKVSTGCLSAKDRTGLVSALKIDRALKGTKFSQLERRRILRKQLKADAPPVRVICDNTGTKVMKIQPFFIEGITKGDCDLKGFIARSRVYARQAVEIMEERRRVKMYEKYGKAACAA